MEKKQNLRLEIIGGITTFFTMSYIVLVNPSILATPGTGMSFSGVLTATVFLCFTMTLLMGLYAKLPFGVAPGMGINAFFTYSLILGQKIPWQQALGLVFWSGVLFVIISATPLRLAIAKAIPEHLRIASAAGIGLFLAFIGLRNSGMVVADPATLVRFGGINLKSGASLVGLTIMLVLFRRKNPFAFLAGIFTVTVIALACSWVQWPEKMLSTPDFSSTFLALDIWGSLQLALIPAIISLMLTDLFDSISTLVGVSYAAKITDANGEPRNLKQGLLVDAFATLFAGVFGTSSGTAYIESAAGVEAGARTGKASVVTALCFLPCFFIAPLAAIIPAYATAPVLIVVGCLMFRSVTSLPTKNIEEIFPAYLTLVLIPLTFSITQGILWGFISHVVLFLLVGRRKELGLASLIVAAVCVGLLSIQP